MSSVPVDAYHESLDTVPLLMFAVVFIVALVVVMFAVEIPRAARS